MKHEALSLALMCQRAYDEHTGSAGDLEYLIWGSTIAIRGTEANDLVTGLGFIDVIRDLRIMPWKDSRVGWAHAGMLKGARAVFEDLEPQISQCGGVPKFRGSEHVTVTGHSLGAGVGLILAHMLDHAGLLVDFTGFGTPRCMISKPRPTIHAQYYRNGDDGVTQVPRWWMGGYRALPQISIGDDRGIELISDHLLDAYVDSLTRCL